MPHLRRPRVRLSSRRAARSVSPPQPPVRDLASVVDDGLTTQSPRVLEVPHYASLYVEVLSPTGEHGGRSATGFIVRNSERTPFLMTNRHVVTGGRQSLGKSDGQPRDNVSALRVFFPSTAEPGRCVPVIVDLWDADGSEADVQDHRPAWLEHPDLGWRADVVAIPLPGHIDIEMHTDFAAYYPAGPVLPRLAITDELYVVGFPLGFDPKKAPLPLGVWTRGTIAWHPTLDWQQLPATLLDCRARPGQSGSPVLFYANEYTTFTTARGERRKGNSQTFDLVGIYSGRIVEGSDIGIVWKRSAIETIIECGVRPSEPLVTQLLPEVDRDRLVLPEDEQQPGRS
ncbi:trypsin-like peptidase domain-containing protein [Streptomyces rubiginosohelvolus]|uniref:trypsin-like peptidase domain-containing protein n=1 Tax=Streptomyces rubiginosohelvolus TaxID=67362 RepID=UPI003823C6A7